MGKEYYNPRTYQRDKTKEFDYVEICGLIDTLKKNPIEKRWSPVDMGFCRVQRVPANNTSGTHFLVCSYDDMDDCYEYGHNGTVYIQIGRKRNTPWYEDSGATYMCFKW